MTTTILISVTRGAKQEATILTFDRLDGPELAQVEEAAHALIDKVDRLAKADAK